MKFSQSQLERASEIIGNTAVVWFSAGVISPVFTIRKRWEELVYFLATGMLMAVLFFVWSLFLLKGAGKLKKK